MNIFLLDHVLESAQILCSVHYYHHTQNIPYKLAYKNHPCNVWARKSLSNYISLCTLAYFLCQEYEYRYNRIHKTFTVIQWCISNTPDIIDIGLTPPAQAMPNQYKNNNYVEAYRNYYKNEKRSFAKWTNRPVPDWF